MIFCRNKITFVCFFLCLPVSESPLNIKQVISYLPNCLLLFIFLNDEWVFNILTLKVYTLSIILYLCFSKFLKPCFSFWLALFNWSAGQKQFFKVFFQSFVLYSRTCLAISLQPYDVTIT